MPARWRWIASLRSSWLAVSWTSSPSSASCAPAHNEFDMGGKGSTWEMAGHSSRPHACASGPAPPDLGSSGRDRSPLAPLGMSRSTRADVCATFRQRVQKPKLSRTTAFKLRNIDGRYQVLLLYKFRTFSAINAHELRILLIDFHAHLPIYNPRILGNSD